MIRITRLAWEDLVLEDLDLPERLLRLTLGLGSGMTRRAGESDRVWALGDRGPNLKIKVAISRYGLKHLKPLRHVAGAKILPRPALGPSLTELRVHADRVEAVRTLPLTTPSGRRFTGLPIPGRDAATIEPAFDLDGSPLAPDWAGADTEAVVALADDGFIVAEEYGPSLLLVDANGVVRTRWVPKGAGAALAGADYAVVEALPAKALRRRPNRGFEALALSPDERSLHLMFQSGFEGDDPGQTRLWTLDVATGALLAERFYPFDRPRSFQRDLALGDVGDDDLKVCEAVCLADDRLLVLERVSATARLYVVDLTGGVAKRLVFCTDDHPEVAADLEGMALLSDRTVLLVTDNDFGVEGTETAFYRVDFEAPLAG
jgi:hypothetical protein